MIGEGTFLRAVQGEINRYRDALEEIASADPVDMALDPTWAQRIAAKALTAAPSDERTVVRAPASAPDRGRS